MNKVVLFIQKLKDEITADKETEAKDYQTYSEWCNETIKQATENIQTGEATIEDCNTKITRLSGSRGGSQAEIEHAEKNLAENKERQKGAMSEREKELKEFTSTKDGLEVEIKDLEDAKKELLEGKSDAAAPSGSFLQNKKKDSHLRRAIALVQKFLAAPGASKKLGEDALKTLNFLVQSSSPQLVQIDDSESPPSALDSVIAIIDEAVGKFQEELNEEITEEKGKADTFAKLFKTLTEESAGLKKNLLIWKKSQGSDGADLASTTALRDETEESLKADKNMLTTTQDGCKERAHQFSQRSAMRADELKGIDLTLEILTDDKAKKTFADAAAVSFVQLTKSNGTEAKSSRGAGREAYRVLKGLASKYKDLKLAQIAVKCKSGGVGAFYKVIQAIDAQLKHLQEEEKEDLEHRGRCQNDISENAASLATLEDSIKKTTLDISRLSSKASDTTGALGELEKEVEETKVDTTKLTEERDAERKAYLVAVKHDKEALFLIQSAIEQITKFFKKNKVSLSLGQEKKISLLAQAHGYKPKPKAGFDDENYKPNKDSTKAVVDMMEMVKEDMAAEIKSGKEEDAENQELYENDYKALKEVLESQKTKQITLNKLLAEQQGELQSLTDTNSTSTEQQTSELEEKQSLAVDCGWIKTKFQQRRDKRKAEMDGLVEAKGMLAGAEPP